MVVSLIYAFLFGGIGGGYGFFNLSGFKKEDLDLQDLTISKTALIAIIFVVITVVIVVLMISAVISILVLNPLMVGMNKFFITNLDEKAKMGELGSGFTNSYGKVVLTLFLQNLYIFLWTLLLIIPGIIKRYEYRMVIYILADSPLVTRKEAFQLSKKMMSGQKWKAFVLDLSFIGWQLLNVLTLGILGIFYVNQYYMQTSAALYCALKQNDK